jgi:hypothetical protein
MPRMNAVCERMIGTPVPRALQPAADHQRASPAPGPDRIPDPLQHSPAAPHPAPVATGPSSRPATADRPRRAPRPPTAGPRRPHARVSDRRLTAVRHHEKQQVTATFVYSSPTGCRLRTRQVC